jgi:GH35 family endo-1,4-beta-xylanase
VLVNRQSGSRIVRWGVQSTRSKIPVLALRFDLHRIRSCFTAAFRAGGAVAFAGVVGCGDDPGGDEVPVESGECETVPCASPSNTGPANAPEPVSIPEPVTAPPASSGDDSGPSTSPGASEPEPVSPPTPPSPASNLDKFVGNITTQNQVRSDFTNHWDQITPENEGKWGSVESARDQMNWSAVDAIVDFARQNSIPFKQHTFVWGDQAPSWLDSLSQDEQRDEIEEWIRLFCERYPDTPMIDVVNEPDHKTPTFVEAMGGAGTTGHDWVIWSFQTARRHCPNSILILNDYNVLRWDTDNFISIANKVRDTGYLDAVADQAHGLEDITLDELQANLQKVADIGVDVYISEYDLDIADDATQAAVMEEQFTLFHEHPSIVGITLWGYVYGATWREHTGLVRNGQPRPAMTWLMDYLGR